MNEAFTMPDAYTFTHKLTVLEELLLANTHEAHASKYLYILSYFGILPCSILCNKVVPLCKYNQLVVYII